MFGTETNLINDVYGALTVVRLVGKVQHGRNNIKVWSCVCACGNELEVDQNSLKKGHVLACKTCRRGPCVICFQPITNHEYSVKRNTCSDKCQRDQTRLRHKRRYYKLIADNPNYNKERHKSRSLKDPNYEKKRYQQRLKKLYSLPISKQQEIIKKQNEYSNLWRSNYVKNLKSNDPEAYRLYRIRVNLYFRSWYKTYNKTISRNQL